MHPLELLVVVEFVARVHFACSMFDCIVFSFFLSFLFFMQVQALINPSFLPSLGRVLPPGYGFGSGVVP